ncbi:MAG: hemerythrin domain-containing protein [Solirubrobacterales bacterium]
MEAQAAFEIAHPETRAGRRLHTRLLYVHAILREDLAKVERMAAEIEDGLMEPGDFERELADLKENGPLWTLKQDCLAYCQLLHSHHTGEDARLFPSLRELNPELGPAVDRLEREHQDVSGLLDQIEAAAARLEAEDSGEVRAETASLLKELRELLLAHLEFEEAAAGPTIRRLNIEL